VVDQIVTVWRLLDVAFAHRVASVSKATGEFGDHTVSEFAWAGAFHRPGRRIPSRRCHWVAVPLTVALRCAFKVRLRV
jgi:hypothetical protein